MKKTITIFALLINFLATAQDGTLDNAFGTGGKVDFDFNSAIWQFIDMRMDYNNKIVVLGRNSSENPILVRLNLDGTLDTSFDGDGIKEINFGVQYDTPASFYIDDNDSNNLGYIVASSRKGAIAKINNDGSFASFGTNGFFYYNANNYATGQRKVFVNIDYDNGTIVVASDEDQFLEQRIGVYKILASGALDSGFNGNNPLLFYMSQGDEIVLNGINTDDSGGSFYVSGYKPTGTGNVTYIKKFSNTGVLDNSYNLFLGEYYLNSFGAPGIIFNGSDDAFASYTFGMDYNSQMIITKRTSTGLADTSFGSNSAATVDFTNFYAESVKDVTGHEFESSFKIILAGRSKEQSFSSSNISLARINSNGSLDTSFGTAGKVTIPTQLYDLHVSLSAEVDYDNGKIYVMGNSASNTVSLYRFNLSSILSNPKFNTPEIAIFPNPTNAMINFSQEINNLEVFDIMGKKIKSFEKTSATFDVTDLEKGIYLLKGKANNTVIFNEKLIRN